jgi:hypothetical protein
MAIVKRLDKGSALTYAELDGNFDHLTAEDTAVRAEFAAADVVMSGTLTTAYQAADAVVTSAFSAADDVAQAAAEATAQTALDAHTGDTSGAHADSAITYTPAGTGAVVRNVQAKLREKINVKDFGAVGDGSTDDTAAINKAFTYANSLSVYGVVEFDAGIYSVQSGGLISPLCDIYGPKAILKANNSDNANLLTITGLSYGQNITLLGLQGYDFNYSFTDTRYGTGIAFNDDTGSYMGPVVLDLMFIQGFTYGFRSDASTLDFHVGSNVFNIRHLWYNTYGIYSNSGDHEFENNIFNIVYATANKWTVFSVSSGTYNNCQNIYNIATLELHNIPNTVGFYSFGAKTNQNIYNVDSLSYDSNTDWIVETNDLPYGNVYNLPGGDLSKFSFGDDVLRMTGIGPLNGSTGVNETRSLVYGEYPPPTVGSWERTGDRYIVNNPTAGGIASMVFQGSAWVPETFSTLSGTCTLTGTGFSGTAPSVTANYTVYNNIVFLYIPYNTITGTSNATTFTITGLPAAIRPTVTHVLDMVIAQDNGTTTTCSVSIYLTGVIDLGNGLLGGAWTNSGTKGLYTTNISWSLD